MCKKRIRGVEVEGLREGVDKVGGITDGGS